MSTLLGIDEPPRPLPPKGYALWALGFRPFYLFAAVFSALSIVLWALQFSGVIALPYLRGPVWHAHEMLFGYTLAIIVGFLFTAGQNWTGQPTPKGGALAALVALWLAGRVMVLTPWGVAAALVNVAFPLAAAAGIARPLIAAQNKRNYFFVGMLVLMALAQAVVHAVQLGRLTLPTTIGLQFGLDIVLFIMTVMAGRVVPMFTNNGVPGTQAVRHPQVEKLVLGSVLALLAADAVGLRGGWLLPLLLVAALAHGTRLWLWQPWRTTRAPLVWVLHAAYAWIPLHLLLRAGAEVDLLAASTATHALTAGAIGTLTLGMMTRTARGHTAQPLRADRWDTIAYVTVLAAAVVRVFVPMLAPSAIVVAALVSGVLWSAAFAIYVWRYAPLLIRPRADGRPG
jgi:uncharacterized protein involved in response to NO